MSLETPWPSVLLASRSPRRREFLSAAGIPHLAEHPGFDDSVLAPGLVSPSRFVAALAYLKAWAGARLPSASNCRVILGADTTCIHDDRMIGTPRDEAEAVRMLHRLSDSTHDVVTAVAVIDSRQRRRTLFTDAASVTVGHLTESMINDYVASGAWQGKAGAYNLSERIAAGWPLRCEGDETTVMGLPMRKLLPLLRSIARDDATHDPEVHGVLL